MLNDNKLEYPIAIDDGQSEPKFKVNGVPANIFVSNQGDIINEEIGRLDADTIKQNLDKLLK